MELLSEALSSVNIAMTVLLGLMLLYWLAVIVGVADIDLFDGMLPDGDIEVEAPDGVAGDGAAGHGGWLMGMLHWMNIGELPLMVVLSLMVLSLWTINMIANHYLNPQRSMYLAGAILVGNVAVSIMVTKAISTPFRRLYGAMDRDHNASGNVIGRVCVVRTTQVSSRMGQAEMPGKGAPILLNVVSKDGQVLRQGQQAIVLEQDKTRRVYLIAPADQENSK